MATAFQLPTAATPIERILSRFDRQQIADFIEVAISLLDVANDPDAEDADAPEDDDPKEDGDPAEEDDGDVCLTREDQGTRRQPRTPKMGFGRDEPMLDDNAENGHDAEETYISPIKPKYGDDQSKGPTNGTF